jgi:hypothetical protein
MAARCEDTHAQALRSSGSARRRRNHYWTGSLLLPNSRAEHQFECPGPGSLYLGRVFESPEMVFVRSLDIET